MNFLWLTLALSMLPALCLWLLRRRGKPALRYSNPEVVRAASSRPWLATNATSGPSATRLLALRISKLNLRRFL